MIRNDGMVVTASFFCDAISLISTRHRELLLRSDLSSSAPVIASLSATRPLICTCHRELSCDVISRSAPVIASLFCDAISLLCIRHREPLLRRDLSDLHPSSRASLATRSLTLHPSGHVLTARLLHHLPYQHSHTTLTWQMIRNDGMVVTASFFCDAISLICTRHREPLFDAISLICTRHREPFATRSLLCTRQGTS